MLAKEAEQDGASLEAQFLRVLHHCWGTILGRALRRNLPGNLTPQQLFVLKRLSQCPAQPSELARDHSVGMSTMTGLIDGLAARGLVDRQQDQRDRRVIHLMVTPAGRELWEEAEASVHEAIRQILAPLSAAQRKRLVATLGDLEGLLHPDAAAGGAEHQAAGV